MPAAGRVVEVDVDRLPGWVERFGDRHGDPTAVLAADSSLLRLTAPDGAAADLAVPYGQLSGTGDMSALVTSLMDQVIRPRTVGIVLVRRGGWAVGVAADGVLVSADTGGGHVQGTTKAGGWSQQRYARRRRNQARRVYDRAADGTAAVLLPQRETLDSVVTGGDREAVATVLADPRLAGLVSLVEPRFFAVADPSPGVLSDVVRRLRMVVITLNELA